MEDLYKRYTSTNNHPQPYYQQLLTDPTKRGEKIIASLTNGLNIKCPEKCKKFKSTQQEKEDVQNAIKYPALSKNKSFSFKYDKKRRHAGNDEKATKIILQRLEQIARQTRNIKGIGEKTVELLMSIPSKDSNQILNEMEVKGVTKIASLKHHIERKVSNQLPPKLQKKVQLNQSKSSNNIRIKTPPSNHNQSPNLMPNNSNHNRRYRNISMTKSNYRNHGPPKHTPTHTQPSL